MATPSYTRTNGANPDAFKVWPMFEADTVLDQAASAQAGRQIYREREMVKIVTPGNMLNIFATEVTDEHRNRWPEAYKAFKDGRDLTTDGTPLEEWPILNRAMVAELKHLGFRSVENLANASDTALQTIGKGGYSIRERAKAFLDDADRIALEEQLAHKNDLLEAQVATLTAQVEQLGEMTRRLHAEAMEQRDAPHLLATSIPGMGDPLALAAQNAAKPAPAASALDAFSASPKRRGRPPAASKAA